MKKILFAISLVWSSVLSCAKPFAQYPEEIRIRVQSFYDNFGIAAHTPIYIVKDVHQESQISGTKVIGNCNYTNSGNFIRLEKQFWETSSFNRREQLIYHELGHCVCNLPHIDTTGADGVAISLMTAVLISDVTYTEHRQQYIEEMRELIVNSL